MPIVGGLDIHRKQLTYDYVDLDTGRLERGRIAPADREHLARWLSVRFDGQPNVAFALEAGTGWRYVVEEMRQAGVDPHLAEPVDTSALRGPKRRAKTDRADALLLRELLIDGRVPECYIPPPQVLEWRAALELYDDLRTQHTGWAQRIHAVVFHQGAPSWARPASCEATGSGCSPWWTTSSPRSGDCRSTPPWPSWTPSASTSTGSGAACSPPPATSAAPAR
jgi:transposase